MASIKEIRFSLAIPSQLDERIEFYRRYIEAGLDFGKENPDRYHLVLYEQLVESPEATLKRMMAWLGETFEPGQLRFNAFPQQSGLEDPNVANTSEIHTESTGRWQVVLSHEEAKSIWRDTYDLRSSVDPDGLYDEVIKISHVLESK